MKLLATALLGLAALAVASPAASIKKSGDVHNNDAATRFHCVDEVEIVACAIEGVCTAVKVCESKCIEKELGATCVVATSSTVTERDDIEEMKKKNQHKECADDGKSVLMCRYGFCSIDEYCPKGTKCRKNCNCCRPNHQKREIEDGDEDVHDDAAADSRSLSVRAAGEACSQPGTYECVNWSFPVHSKIMVCNTDHIWQLSADCENLKCAQTSPESAPRCMPKRWDSQDVTDSHALSARAATPEVAAKGLPCDKPGAYTCINYFPVHSKILVCNAQRVWQLSVDCGETTCRQSSPSAPPRCMPKNKASSDLERRLALAELNESRRCTPGEYRCGKTRSYIEVCNSLGIWQISAVCGKGACHIDAQGLPHCMARRDTFEVAKSVGVCPPGAYRCAGGYKGISARIDICNAFGNWQLSADCGSGDCIYESNGSPHCVARRDAPDIADVPNDQPTALDEWDCPTVGQFACSDPTARWIFICNPQHRWEVSSDCGQFGACKTGPDGQPHCYAQELEDNSSLESRDPYDCPIVGQWSCSAGGSRYIMICSPAKRWVESADCGHDNGCRYGPDGSPRCYGNIARIDGGIFMEATTLAIVAKGAAPTAES